MQPPSCAEPADECIDCNPPEAESDICPAPFLGNVQPTLINIAGRNHEFRFSGPLTRLDGGRSPSLYKIERPKSSEDAWWIAEAGTIRLVCRDAWITRRLWLGHAYVQSSDLHMVMGPGHPDSRTGRRGRAVQAHHIDDETLPFSEAEFYAAFRLIQSEKRARESAAFITQIAREVREQMERARLARERGSGDPRELAVPGLVVPDEVFALLAAASPELRARADAFMRARWAEDRKAWLRDGMYRPGGTVLREPTPEVHAEVEARVAAAEAEWEALCQTTRADVERRQKRRR